MYCDDIRSPIRKPKCSILSIYFTLTIDIDAVTVFVNVLL